MTNAQWQILLDIIKGKNIAPLPIGFIIDSPWLPGWNEISILDYYSSDQLWFNANRQAIQTFPEVIFLPGFWAEFGMCTEPSAFGVKCSFYQDELPFAEKNIHSPDDIDKMTVPDPNEDGLLPLVLNRLKLNQRNIEQEGHLIKFAVSRGPLNLATFLMGTTEFLTAIKTDPDKTAKLLEIITDFIIEWLTLQKQTFSSIDGILILDDIVGFLVDEDFKQVAYPYLKQIFSAFDAEVKFFHNDAPGLVCSPYLPEIGVNLFNFSSDHDFEQIKELTGNKVTLLGNIPPRDVLAQGTAEQISQNILGSLRNITDKSRIILSCGGGMPDRVSTENIKAFINTTKKT